MSNVYDLNGNPIIEADISQEMVTQGIVAGIVDGDIVLPMVSTTGQTLSVTGSYYSSAKWVENEHTAYSSMFAQYKELGGNSVPFFATSDQHGNGLNGNRQANNIDIDGIEFSNLNCGDTDPDAYYEPTINGYRLQSRYIKNYASTVGNHDLKGVNEADYSHAQYVIRYGFITTRPNAKFITNQMQSYSYIDGKHGCKFIMLDLYDYRGMGGNKMPHPYMNTETIDWLIHELMETDNCDVVFITHEPLFESTNTIYNRDGVASSYTGYGLRPLLLARKTKSAGTFTDSEGVVHNYDFTDCSTELLCTLHGHTHEELWCNDDGLTTYTFMNGQCGTFGLVDRENELLRIYRFDETNVYDELTIAL